MRVIDAHTFFSGEGIFFPQGGEYVPMYSHPDTAKNPLKTAEGANIIIYYYDATCVHL